MRTNPASRRQSGFTLVEMLVASVLMSLVLGGVYTLFSGAFSSWRGAEDNVRMFRDARIGLGLMRREFAALAPDAGHLTLGEEDTLSFAALTEPLNVEMGTDSRLFWITYRLERNRNTDGWTLMRDESPIIGPIPHPMASGVGRFADRLEVGEKESFVLARGIEHLKFTYLWSAKEDGPVLGNAPKLQEFDQVEGTWPEGIRVRLSSATGEGESAGTPRFFETMFAYRGVAGAPPKARTGTEGALR